MLALAVGCVAVDGAADDAYKCEPPLSQAQSVGLVIGTIVGSALMVTIASFMAGLAPVAPSREDVD
jgi:hypothetical protein